MTPAKPQNPPKPAAEKKPAARPRGRPARLSREQIVAAVLSILEREPAEVPTIARIAQEIDAVPAALYRHFGSLDEVLDAVITQVLGAGPSGIEPGVPWPDQLATWMHALRDHLLRFPAVLAMIDRSGRTSPAWLESSSALIEILESAGLSGRELASNYLWILETTVGIVMQEAALPFTQQLANARATRSGLSQIARHRFASIAQDIERIDGDEFFAFVVEQTKSAVARSQTLPKRR